MHHSDFMKQACCILNIYQLLAKALQLVGIIFFQYVVNTMLLHWVNDASL
jgi:hypothetical protein